MRPLGPRWRGREIPVCALFYSVSYVVVLSGVLRFSCLPILCSFPTVPVSDGENWGRQQEWVQRVVDPFKGMGTSGEWPRISGTAAKTLDVNLAPPPKTDLRIPDFCFDFFSWKLDFAISPHRGRRPPLAASETDDKSKAWQWIFGRMGEGVRNPDRFNKDLVGATGIISAQLFRLTSGCRLPLFLGASAARELLEMRTIASEQRMQTDQWQMDSQRAGRREYWEAVDRNLDRAPTPCPGAGESESW